MLEVRFYDTVNDELLKFAVIISQRRVRTKFWTTIGLRKEPFYVF